MKRSFTLIEVLICLAIAAIVSGLGYAWWHEERVTLPAAYKAWVKQTGNANQLTYDEWRSLVQVRSEIVFIPQPQ